MHWSSYTPGIQFGFTHTSSPPYCFNPCRKFLAASVRVSALPLCSGKFTLSSECCHKGCEKMSLSHGLVTIPCLHPAGAQELQRGKTGTNIFIVLTPHLPEKKGKNRRSLWVEVNSGQRLKGCEGEAVTGKYEETRGKKRIDIFYSILIKPYYFESCTDHTGR